MPSNQRNLIVLLFVVLLALMVPGEDRVEPKVTSIEPHDGSYMGGTRLYISGQGFSSSGNFVGGQSSAGNKAFLLSDFEKVPCDVENDASHETMIVCYTRPMKLNNNYFIQVEVDGVEVPFETNCNNSPRNHRCRFITRWWLTPYIRTCHVSDGSDFPMQRSHEPGSLITCSGRIYTQIYGSHDQVNENERTVSIRRAYAAGRKCELLKQPDEFYDLRLTSGDEGTYTCKTDGTFIGVQNVSLILGDNFGRADIDKRVYKTNSKDKVYHFQTYAEITGISPKVGSLGGGTRISIQGKNFDNTTEPVRVFIGGVQCEVIPETRTSDGVDCIAGQPPEDKEYYTGSRGIRMETWDDSVIDNDDALLLDSDADNYGGEIILDSTGYKWNNGKDNFIAKYTGVFVVPRNDRYRFQIAADDDASLYVNCEGKRGFDDLEKVAYTDRPTSTFSSGIQFSEWMELNAGQECFFIGVMRDYAHSGYMYVAVRRATTTLTGSQSIDAKNEIQVIDFSAKFLREKQVISLAEWSGQTGEVEEQEVTVSHSCIGTSGCDISGYRLVYEGVKTGFLAADAPATTVQSALRNILELSDEDVVVSEVSGASSGEMKYVVQFNKKRGDYSDLAFERYPATVEGLTVTIVEKAKGVAEKDTFKLRLGGRATTALAKDADRKAIHAALNETLDAICPSFILPDKRKSTVLTTIDYETTKHGEEWGSRQQNIEAFCGRTSIINCEYPYYAGRTADNKDKTHRPFDVVENRWLCLAHRGLMHDNLHLTGTFEGSGRKTSGTHSFSNPLTTHETEWSYSCIDLLETIRSRRDFAHVDAVKLSIIRFPRKGRDYDFHLDAITIGSEKTAEDPNIVWGLRTPPALANGRPLEWLTVTEVEGKEREYEIEIDTWVCGDQLPLIETAAGTGGGLVASRLVSGITPMSGKFDLVVNFNDGRSHTIKDIDVDISVEKFAERLELEAPGFGQAKVWRAGSCHARDFGIEWLTNGGDKPMMELKNVHGVNGADDISSRIYTQQDGGVLHNPMTGDMLRLAYSDPQVEVMINGYPSKCSGDCQFTTSEDVTPVINSISPTSGSKSLKTSITISGSKLSAVVGSEGTTVMIGQATCTVTSSSDSAITCDLGDGPLGTHNVVVNVGGKGHAMPMSESVSLNFTISGGINSVTPSTGFASGGTELEIAGYGFSATTVFYIGSAFCDVITRSPTLVTCVTPANDIGSKSVTASDGDVNLASSLSFEYQNTTAVVSGVSPTVTYVNGGINLTLHGAEIAVDGVAVLIGDKSCLILEKSSDQIICSLPSLRPDTYEIQVVIPNKGYAEITSSDQIVYALQVDGVSPKHASMNGGTKIVIEGNGFIDGDTAVKFGDSICEIDSIALTSITCTTSRFTKVYRVTNNGFDQTRGEGFEWDHKNLNINVGDTVVWEWEFIGAPGGWDYGARVFTTEFADSDTYDGVTFESSEEKSAKGSYSYTFNNEGTFYVSSGRVDHPDWGWITMRQSITVGPAVAAKHELTLSVAGHDALHELDTPESETSPPTCEGVVSSIDGCVTTSIDDDSGKYFLTSDPCYSPTITSISPNNGTTATEITIEGVGFSPENCANNVVIGAGYHGEYGCDVLSSTKTKITCKPAPTENTPINIAFDVKVSVDNIGDTNTAIELDGERRFILLPRVSAVSPKLGSLEGGTLVTISGSGFTTMAASNEVTFGGYSCQVQSSSYFEIKCLTPSSTSARKRDIAVTVNGQQVECTEEDCSFEYDSESTPIINSITPTSVNSHDTNIVIAGEKFSADSSLVDISIGERTCEVSESSEAQITCVIDELPAGDHSLKLTIAGKGLAKLDGVSKTITSLAEITSMSPVNGSKAGGTVLTFAGNGFSAEDMKVKVSNTLCPIVEDSVTNFMFKCATPAKSAGTKTVTVTANGQTFNSMDFKYHNDLTPTITSITPSKGKAGDMVTITGEKLLPDDMTVNIGDSLCEGTDGNSESITCTLTEHPGGEYEVSANVGIFGLAQSNLMFNYTFSLISVTPSAGSHAGGDMVTISGQGFSENAIVKICENVCEHGIETEGSSANIDEIICKVSSSQSDDIETDKHCDVSVSVDGQSVAAEHGYIYASNKTPKVTGITPSRGGTEGGTSVTITGTLFDEDTSKVSVTIAGVPCEVTFSNASMIVCTTDSRGHSVEALVEVQIEGKGLAINDAAFFYYIDVWSSRWTWGGNDPPVAGDFVVVPSGQTLLLDIDTPVMKMLLIQGGVVIFDEKDIHLQTENVLITDGGVLQIGTEEEPFQHKAIITMHGNLLSPELPIYGTKTIGVRNGTLDFHGKHVPLTWTLLEETASAGGNEIRLKDAVTWAVGDEIVIATTGDRHSQKETETATIASISKDGTILTLEAPLVYTHISEAEQFDGILLETRAEVGLLTRNIVVQGSTHLEWSKEKIPACEEGFNTGEFVTQTCFQGRFGEEEGSDQFGAQIMIHHRAPNLDIARARLEYVELRNVGQAFRLGRYPIHFHLLGDVGFRNYVKGCAIHRSFNRAITIHNTHHLLVERNVIYDVMGGAVFIEDGIEHGNVIQQNLVLFCKQSTSLQNDDITPAAFWVTNPNNTLQHNAAAGGTHFGFWYRIHSTPDGPSADPNICQQLHPLQKFQNNTVHSQGWFGLWVFQKYTPRGDGSCGANTPNIAEFHTLTAWNCEKGAELVNVGAIKFIDFVMAHNSKAGIETKLVVDSTVRWGQVGTYNSFIIARAHALTEGSSTERGMILPFTEAYEVKNTKFINFDETGNAAIGVTSIDGTCIKKCGGWEARFTNTSFQNTPNKAAFRWEHEVSIRDMDGSLTGKGHESVVVPFNPTVSETDCPKMTGFDTGEFDGVVCDGTKKFHRVSWNEVLPTSLQAKDVTFSNENGDSFIPFEKKRLTHKFGWMGMMMDGETYKWVFQDADQITNMSYKAGFYNFEQNDCVIVSHNLTQKPDKFEIAGEEIDSMKDDMVSCDNNYHGDYYFDATTKTLFYVVSGRDRPSRKKRFVTEAATEGAVNRNINFRVYRCFHKNCTAPPDPNSEPPVRERPSKFQIWHNNAYWKRNTDGEYVGTPLGDGTTSYPPEFVDVRIESETWMVVKQDLNKINKLWIEGVLELEFEDENLDVTLSATHIIITGGRLIVGWEDASFRGTANIILRGDHNTEDILLNGGINLGAKAIGVIGGLDLHGKERALRTTHLASALQPGQNSITIEGSPNGWVEGDEIVIATTSADPWETETFKIMSVNDKTITLNTSAKFEHIAETFSFEEDDSTIKSYDIRAEVSMLSRNIKVIGEDYSNLFGESFGARILIAGEGSGSARGYARIQNVEFYHSGQEGFIDNYDPRYSLAFLNTGPVDTVKPSIVKRNTFHNGFNTAIGVFGASGLDVVENTIHHTVGPGIRVEGENITLDRNLVMLTRTRSVYQDRVESDLLLWKAAIEVNLAKSPKLTGNVVVGSERAGFRIDGHDCSHSANDVVEWGWNIARATLQGVFLNKDGFVSCTHISKFKIHNAHDNGVYCQVEGNVKMSDILITDSNFGFSAIIFAPKSLSHVMQNKQVTIENSIVVAVSKPGYCTALKAGADYLSNAPNARPRRREGANKFTRAGILWPAFISGHNNAPVKPFLGSLSYPAIGGKTSVNNLTFVNFGDVSCSRDHSAFLTNVKIEDYLHPIETSNLKFVNSPDDTRVHFHRPSIGAINPSDCVDMECDGMKKALLVDKDGSMLGQPGSAFPQAEFEWDGDSRRGLGDYRIPKTLLTDLDGNAIDASDLVPNKGILRENTATSTCTKMDAWNGHACSGYHHGILVIESLDADTETRRLSPVALKVGSYIDLNNGPQDHGWCAGYTCQERLSTFWTIVAMNNTYELHFSSTAPKDLGLRLLNEDIETKIVVKIYFTRPQRKDIYVNGHNRIPLNYDLDENGQDFLRVPTYFGEFFPTTNSFIGDNYYDRAAHSVYVTLGGGDTFVQIHEANLVVFNFRLPAISPDEFFDNGKLVQNLAFFLNIPLYKIKLVRVIRENSRRRRQADGVGDYTATVEIGDSAAATINETSSNSTEVGDINTNSASVEELNSMTATVTNALQEGELSSVLGTGVPSLTVIEPRRAAVRNATIADSNNDELEQIHEYYVPVGLRVVEQPTSGKAGVPLSPVLTVTGINASGSDIILGHNSDQWHATVVLIEGDQSAELTGTTIAAFEDGLASFNNLAISLPGSFVLRISVTYPENMPALTVITIPFTLNDTSPASSVSTTITPQDTDVSNLAVVITCAVVGGLLLIAIVATLILKGPCSKNPNRTKVSRTNLRPYNSPPPYTLDLPRPPSTKSALNAHFYEEPQHPHAVMNSPPYN